MQSPRTVVYAADLEFWTICGVVKAVATLAPRPVMEPTGSAVALDRLRLDGVPPAPPLYKTVPPAPRATVELSVTVTVAEP